MIRDIDWRLGAKGQLTLRLCLPKGQYGALSLRDILSLYCHICWNTPHSPAQREITDVCRQILHTHSGSQVLLHLFIILQVHLFFCPPTRLFVCPFITPTYPHFKDRREQPRHLKPISRMLFQLEIACFKSLKHIKIFLTQKCLIPNDTLKFWKILLVLFMKHWCFYCFMFKCKCREVFWTSFFSNIH